ncbi:LodA/GoxA family CTQ-dependent oxidase [Tunturiibacter psychrotolerans]
MLTDDAGRLLVLGGFGKSGGDTAITSFAGADTWHKSRLMALIA